MKKLSVSRQTHPATFKKCRNLGQLIAVIEKEGEAQNLFVTKVYLNDRAMDEDEEKLLDSMSIGDVQSLEFDLSTIEEIIKNSISDIIQKIQHVQLKAIEFGKKIRDCQQVDDEEVKFVLIQCRQIIESLEHVFVAHDKKSFLVKHLSLWREAEKELTNILQCILQSRRLTGFEMMADLLEYDLVQALDQWEDVLERELVDNASLMSIFNLKSDPENSDNGVDA